MTKRILTEAQKKSISNYKRMGIALEFHESDKVEVRQVRLLNDYILNQQQLKERGKEVFPDAMIVPITYTPQLDHIDAEWIGNKMKEFGLDETDLSKQLAIAETELSNILNGSFVLDSSQKTTFYFYFMTYELNRDFRL